MTHRAAVSALRARLDRLPLAATGAAEPSAAALAEAEARRAKLIAWRDHVAVLRVDELQCRD